MEQDKNNLGYTPEEYRTFRRCGRRFLLSFSLLYMSMYCCRLNLPAASVPMMRELDLSKAEIGLLSSVLFWTYALGGYLNGRAAERRGPYRFVVLSALLTICVNLLFSFQTSLAAMIALWAVNGFLQSMAWSPGVAAITGWFPENRRGFATGFANSFSGFGQAAASLSVSLSLLLLPGLGWRSAFLLPPAVTTVMLLLFLLLAKEKPEDVGLRPYEETSDVSVQSEHGTGEDLAADPERWYASRSFFVWMSVAFLAGLSRYGLIVWIPLYFSERFGISVTSGLLQSLSLPIGMGFGAMILPSVTDRLCPGDRIRAVSVPAFLAAVFVCVFLLISPLTLTGRILIWLLLFSAGFCVYAINGTAWAYASDIGGRKHSGSCTGLLNLSCYVGAAVQSVVYGRLSGSLGWTAVFVSIALFCTLIGALAFLGRQKRPPYREKGKGLEFKREK